MPPIPKTVEKTGKKEKKDAIITQNEMSEEDKLIKEEIELLIERLNETDEKLYKPALELLRTMIRTSTTSMTSVPKPLKFLRPFFGQLKTIYEKIQDKHTKKFCSDIISVLSMTFATENQDCLNYRLSGSEEEIGSWGHEYVKHLSAELRNVWVDVMETENAENDEMKIKLKILVKDILSFSMKHNCETEACDLLMDIECLDMLKDYVDNENYQRVALYLISCINYVPEPDNTNLLKTAMEIYKIFDKPVEAMTLAIQMNNPDIIKKQFDSCEDIAIKKQMAFILARHNINFLELNETESEDGQNNSHVQEITEILSNSQLNTHFMSLARELDIMEPKVPEDIYKSHLDPIRPTFGPSGTSGLVVDSARQNLASSFVNGFVNAGFGRDKLITIDGGNKWIYKNKDHAMMSATASLGLIYLWDVDIGLAQIDKYLYPSEEYIKAGALLACGIVNTGVKNDCDPALALLSDYVTNESSILRIASFIGLGLAYAGSKRADVLSLLIDGLKDPKSSMEVIGIAALSCGLITIGTQSPDLTTAIFGVLLERSETELRSNLQACRFIALALALTNLGKQDSVEVVFAGLQAVVEPIRSMTKTLVEACAYAGTGNVLKVQEFLHICSEHYESDSKKSSDTANTSSTSKKESSADKLAKNLSSLLSSSTSSPNPAKLTTPSSAGGKSSKKSSAKSSTKPPIASVSSTKIEKSSEKTEEKNELGQTTSTAGESSSKIVENEVKAMDEDAIEMEGVIKEEAIIDDTKDRKGVTKDADPKIDVYEDLSSQQSLAVIGIALIAMGEDIGANMSFRTFGHLMRYGEPVIRRAVPLALALISVSNPSNLNIVDTLSKFSHDTDAEVAQNSIFAMGIVGAGTNNARLAAMLRQLAQFYSKDSHSNLLFAVRIAQALIHAGKGTLTLSPFHCDRLLARPVSLAGLLIVLVSFLDAKNTILGKGHYLLYYLTVALRPRFLITFDPSLNPISVSVRVGQAVDVVGQAGKPKTITGFQTYTSPVLLGYGERAELATEEYLSLSPHLEGFVILKKNPNYMD
ncbi:unnamed protein product [Gordionus sp. m RMFG-2023]|uniref:26S proteasome non-ATPase regulatory subunit 2-like n=1 Tax=Gordionus sp. m RMFG-2023 TaxID=3053472 RepID=UPI0030DFB31D